VSRRALALLLASAAVLPAGAAFAQTSDAVTDLGTIGNYAGSSTILTTSDQLSNGEQSQTDTSLGYAISGDGSTVVGTSVAPGGNGHAFVWTAAGGMTDIGALFSGGDAIAEGVDNAGDVVVGFSTVSGGYWQAFRWTKAGGMVDIGAIGAGTYSFASAVSADGSVVVGGAYTSTTIDRAFRWTQSGGMQNLGTIGNNDGYSDALGVSADGATVVGLSTTAAGPLHAFRWTQGGGMADLGTLGNASGSSAATAANSDGSVVVGQSIEASGGDTHAFRWTASGGMADLGTIGGAAGTSAAFAVDAAGDEVVGYSAFGSGAATHAFLWTQAGGMQDLNTFLANAGVNMTGITLVDARGVSSDGDFVTGSGDFPGASGEQAYLARVGGGSAGLTDFAALVESIEALELSRISQLINNELLSQVLLGLNEQISCGNCGGPYASFGSFDLGAHGRWGLGRDFTILAGFSYGQQRNAGADTKGEISVATALRYDPVELGHSRPFVEVGVTASPWQDTVYTRRYANGMGVATASGESEGQSYSVYGRVGWVARLTKRDELAISGDVGESWQHVGAYAEATANNPFNALVPASTDSMASYGASAQLTHLFGRRLEADVNLGVTQSFSEASGLDADVAPVGPIAAPNQNFTYYEAGGRLGFRLRRGWTVDAFVNAVLARKALGNTAHGGLGLRVDF
jgi:probable HAF family extracellular repeat protein